MAEKTHWKQLMNPDYLGAYALTHGKDLIVTIKSVGQEDVYNPSSNSKETCTVVRFTDGNIKPMIVNATNAKTIAKLFDTPYIEDWVGKSISLYIAKVKAFGDVVEALRVRSKAPTVEKIVCADCGKDILSAAGKTPRELADISMKNTGRELCLPCMQKAAKSMETENKEDKKDE